MSLDILIALFFLVGCLVCSISERRSFNGGICRACGKALKRFDTDSQGGRGYTCGVHYIWASWPGTDGGKP
jgi:hypothetical protein